MSDILDYIRDQLAAQPASLAAVEPVLLDARRIYGGDMVYVKLPPRSRSISSSAGEIATRKVARRTVQRWRNAT